MGDTLSKISDDLAEYRAHCERFGERMQRDDMGLPDCYGIHAKKLKKKAEQTALAISEADECPLLASFSFDDVNDFVHSDGITYELLEGALLDIAAAWQRSRDAQNKLLNREADALAFVAE